MLPFENSFKIITNKGCKISHGKNTTSGIFMLWRLIMSEETELNVVLTNVIKYNYSRKFN